LEIDRATDDVTRTSAEIVTTYADRIAPDPVLAARVQGWKEEVRPYVERVVGTAAEDIVRGSEGGGEPPVADLIASAFRWSIRSDSGCRNAGGERDDIPAESVPWGKLYEVQPFGNDLVQLTLTGRQLERVLNQQWTNQPNLLIMKCSGIKYTWDP